jgi:hypothetical protein
MFRAAFLAVIICIAAFAQTPCTSVSVYEPCDIEFDLTPQEASQHPNPYLTIEVRAEFRGPKGDTYRVPGFWDGRQKMKVRFSPLAEGRWDFRVTSNIERVSGKIQSFTATAPSTPGFVSVFNVHHFRYSKENTGHYWVGDTCYPFAIIPLDALRRLVDVRAGQKFNHLRGLLLPDEASAAKAVPSPDRLDAEYFQGVDQRIRYMNQKGITADLILANRAADLAKVLPNWRDRERFIRYLVARYGAMNITWQGFTGFEGDENAAVMLKEIGDLLKQIDAYHHPRSTGTAVTSGGLAAAGWLDYMTHHSAEQSLFAVEYQLYPAPFVNIGSGVEDGGAKTGPAGAGTDAARHRMWNAAISGEAVTFANTGTGGTPDSTVDLKFADSPGAQQAMHLRDFFAQTRYFDLEPYFNIDGARALALEETEYIVYLEKPPASGKSVELTVHKSGYDVSWFNPISGEWTKEKEFKGEKFTVSAVPDPSHDWVLYVRREGRKQGMSRSYKFESRTPVVQDIQAGKRDVPFTIQLPSEAELPVGQPLEFNATLTKPGASTRNMVWLWTGEVSSSGLGYRVLGANQFGTFTIPPDISREYPMALLVRVFGLDGTGKLFAADKVYTIKK